MIENLSLRFEESRGKGAAQPDFPEGSILEAALLDTKKRIADAFEGQIKIHATLCVRLSAKSDLKDDKSNQ